jgi:DNA-binding transcriptional MerR regulator
VSSGGSDRTGQLSISEVAALAGVSTRAVRHYHAIGLLPEPERDSSGYRRYGGKDVVGLVRIARLRAVGMPLPQIAERVAGSVGDDMSLAAALHALADEVDGEIDQLVGTRDRLRDLAGSETFDQPVRTLTTALQQHGVLGPSDELRAGEGWAAVLLDALHPDGIPGLLDQASGLLADPDTLAVLSTLRRRLGRLNDRATEAEITALADEVAAVVQPSHSGAQLVDIDLIDKLMTDRLNRAQRKFMDQLRARIGGPR